MDATDWLGMIFRPGNFEPHRLHFEDTPQLMWFIIIGNALVALAYFLIPVALIYFIRKRKDLVFHWVFIFFAAFIFFCALTHIMHIVIFWYPLYWLQGIIDAITGLVSIATAIALVPVIPQALKLPSPEQMRKVNTSLHDEIVMKEKAEKEVRALNKNLERRVKARTKDLEEALEQKDTFISMVSHELKTPVTSIKGFTQALIKLHEKDDPEHHTQHLLRIENQLNKLNKLISNLLDITRTTSGDLQLSKEIFQLDELIEDTVKRVQQENEKRTIVVEAHSGSEVVADKDRIRQVVSNLIANAIKYSLKSEKVVVRTVANNNSVTVSVQDFGVGIASKHKKKVFERFFRVLDDHDKTFSGLGVGLYIAKEIVERHEGKIWFESRQKKGSTFYFTLPVRKGRKDNV